METINKYCVNLNIPVTRDVREAFTNARLSYKHLDKFKHYEFDIRHHVFDEFLKDYNVGIVQAEIFYTPPGHILPIHSDSAQVGKNHTRINWVFGEPGHKMYWWEPYPGVKVEPTLTDKDTVYTYYSMEDCELVWTAEVGCPSMVNVGVPHSVYNSTNKGRWNISFMLKDFETNEILQWDKAEKVFASLAQR